MSTKIETTANIVLHGVVKTFVVIVLAAIALSIWDSLSPYQAGVASMQLQDSNSAYAASRAAANFHPFTIVAWVTIVALFCIWVRAAFKITALTKGD